MSQRTFNSLTPLDQYSRPSDAGSGNVPETPADQTSHGPVSKTFLGPLGKGHDRPGTTDYVGDPTRPEGR